jgi:lipopolysaccharide export LptBFGC system permease protein LptF
MSIPDAWRAIRKLKESGFTYKKELVEFHWKFSFPMGILIMILIGAPLSGYSRKNVLITSFLASLVVTFLYYVVLYLGITLGKNERLPPILAAWTGNLILLVIIWFLFRKMRT